MAEAQNGFRKECSSTDPNILPQIINRKRMEFGNTFVFYRLRKSILQYTKILFDILKSRNISDALLKATVDIHTHTHTHTHTHKKQ